MMRNVFRQALCSFKIQNQLRCVNFSRTSSTNQERKPHEGKVAIVTASTDGIGFSIARKLAQNGAHVVLSSRKQNNVDKAVEILKSENLDVSGLVCHVGKASDRENLIERTVKDQGGIDMLISNAGMNPVYGPILDTSETAWDKIFEINVKAGFMLTKAVAPHIEKRGGGSIVFVTSIAGYQALELIAAYSVSKTAILGLTKALAPQCAQMNIRVNAIAPGIIETKFSEG
ncbi:dehydrogenase/reductase SDR family member 4-like, partial [Saccoglossus kowalevskii]|uniref:Dehydrogenase/reductase SDR family member 4-like n=1 Tax=Saccoglossus kowalevskii TaxID=10224 RepID=A0ABM0M5M5_SACKO